MKAFLFQFAGLLFLPLLFALVHLASAGRTPPLVPDVPAADVKLLKLQGVLWVDAREESLFQKEHVPGAVNLNRKNWDQALPTLFEKYTEGQTIIVYCSTGCHEGSMVAVRIRELGLEKIEVLEGGYEGWKAWKFQPRMDTNGHE
jgi:rhodanese-related sulfurtransferase